MFNTFIMQAVFTKTSVPTGVVKGTKAKFTVTIKNVKAADVSDKIHWQAVNVANAQTDCPAADAEAWGNGVRVPNTYVFQIGESELAEQVVFNTSTHKSGSIPAGVTLGAGPYKVLLAYDAQTLTPTVLSNITVEVDPNDNTKVIFTTTTDWNQYNSRYNDVVIADSSNQIIDGSFRFKIAEVHFN